MSEEEMNSSVRNTSVYLCNNVFEQPFFPRICRMGDHCEDSVVVLLIFVVKENQLCP